MRTIYYLGENIDVSNVIVIEVKLTSLGESNLNITKFTGDFIHSITTGSGDPTGTPILETDGEIFSVNVGEVKTVYINLKLNNIDSLPTEVYVETEELGETSSVLIFRGGVDPGVITIPPLLRIQESEIELNNFYVETNKTDVINQNLGTFNIKNIGASVLTIDSINYIDNTFSEEINKDFISFRDSLGNAISTIPANSEIIIYIDVDSRSSGGGVPTKPFLEDYILHNLIKESDLSFNGFIEIISDDEGISNAKHRLSISGGAYAPLISYEVVNSFREDSELIFNYKYNKENTKDLENILKIRNNGNMDLIISDITTNYSISETNVIVYPIATNDVGLSNVTITPGNSFDFNFIFDPIKRANKLDVNGDPILNSLEDYKDEIKRNLIIKSNALNFSTLTDADYGVAFTNSTAINKKEFLSSIWYETTPYSWYPIERNEFIFSLLQPGGRNLQKVQIYNGKTIDSKETFRVQIVYHGEEVGTNAYLQNKNYKNQLTSKDSIFISVEKNKISGSTDFLGEIQTYVNVSLSIQADEDRYTANEQETDPTQGGDINLIGEIRKKYDFVEDKNPFKILITRVTDNQEDSNGNLISFIDGKDKKEYWDVLDGTGFPESLLLYLYAVARRIVYSSNSLATISSSVDMELFDSIQIKPIVNSFAMISLSPSLDLGSEFKGESYGIHQFTTFSYSSSFLNIEGYLEISARVFVPKVYGYSIGNLSISKLIDYFDTQQKTIFSHNLSISSLIGSNIDTSIKQFKPSINTYSLASLSSYVDINDMQDGTSVEVNTGFIQGYVPPDPTLQPPIISSALVNIAIREFESNTAWSGNPVWYFEFWNYLTIDQFDLFIPDEIKSHSIASLSLFKSTIDIDTPLTWGVKRVTGNTLKGFNVASLAIGIDINDMVDGTSVESIQWTPPPPSEVYSYNLINFNISESILFKGSTKEWGINQATATTHPELAISIYSNSIASLSLRKDTTINKPSGAGNMFGVTRFDPSSDPPIISHAVATISVEDINLGELHAS